jgi:hypothetical protein
MCCITLKRSLINDIREAIKASAKSLLVCWDWFSDHPELGLFMGVGASPCPHDFGCRLSGA